MMDLSFLDFTAIEGDIVEEEKGNKLTKMEVKKRLREIENELWKRRYEFMDTPEWKEISNQEIFFERNQQKIRDALVKDLSAVAERYIRWGWGSGYGWFNNFNLRRDDIKPEVRDGIKRGLGVKFQNEIHDEDFYKVVKEVIKKDLVDKGYGNLLKEYDIAEKKLKELSVQKRQLEENRKCNLEKLEKERDELQGVLNDESKKDKTRKLIDEKLPELIESVRKEINRSFILEGIK